jgi:hypothetical protein
MANGIGVDGCCLCCRSFRFDTAFRNIYIRLIMRKGRYCYKRSKCPKKKSSRRRREALSKLRRARRGTRGVGVIKTINNDIKSALRKIG